MHNNKLKYNLSVRYLDCFHLGVTENVAELVGCLMTMSDQDWLHIFSRLVPHCVLITLQGKRGIEKQPFQLPDFIAATGIEKIRQVGSIMRLICSDNSISSSAPVVDMLSSVATSLSLSKYFFRCYAL